MGSVNAVLGMLLLGWLAGQASSGVEATEPPAQAASYVTAIGKGVQIYRCEAKAGGPGWVFVAPEATLSVDGREVGSHGAGPVWRWKDGTAIVGKVVRKASSPEAGAVPWLLLTASPAPGSAAAGEFDRIAYVRRSETHGGADPAATGCDAGHVGAEKRVPYTATYTFYRMPPR